MASFTPLSKHLSFLAKVWTLLSSNERPLSFRCRRLLSPDLSHQLSCAVPRAGPTTFGALGKLHSWRPPPPWKPPQKNDFPRKRNCNFQMVYFPVRLHFFQINTTTIATMNKHELKNKITEKMSRLCWTPLRARPPLFNGWCTHTPPLQPVTFTRSSSQSDANNVFLVFCSVDG